MSCTDIVCGTGGWAGPLPGDPDNNSVLRATPAFGGIDVSWTMPATNPFAVAHTVIRRGISNNFNAAVFLASVGGDFFYDKSDTAQPVEYYYWIQFVSVNGTYGDWIGPASAVAKPLIEKVIEDLTGKIDAGVLAQSLKSEIDKITLNYGELLTEIGNRVAGNAALSAALQDLQNGVTQALAFVNTEITTRIDGDNALAQQVGLIAAANSSNAAAIINEKSARVSKDEALTTQYNAVLAATGNNAAALTVETTARTTADSALASQITTAQATLNGSISSVQTTMQTQINAVTGELDAIYTAKVDVNGMVGGFGIYGTPTSVEAGFDVDRFWVGRTSANKRKPFIIENGTVYIDDAAINKLTFSKLRDEAGTFIVQNGKVKANYIDTNGLVIRDTYGNPIFGAGTALSTAYITGLGSLATASTVSTAQVSGLGSLATQNTVSTNQVSGLGALATENSVAYSSVTGAKPPTNADNTASNTAAAIANQGTLATRNAVAIGTHVTFPDGSLMNTTDFVSRLSKINDTNISTFMSSAAIGNAYIGNAAVDTLKIAGNAVTVPIIARHANIVPGSGSGTRVAEATITLDAPGYVYAIFTANQTYGSGLKTSHTALYMGGQSITVGGAAVTTNICVSDTTYFPVGTHTIFVDWLGQDSGVNLQQRTLFVMGVKR